MTAAEQKILTNAKKQLAFAIEEDAVNRDLAKSDLEFIAVEGKQWPAEIRAERVSQDRPCLTVNKMPVFVDQVVGDQRMNRPAIKVIPVDSVADPKIAKILGGWIKHVQQISKSDIAIDHGFEHAVACAYGAWRIVTKYVSDTSFDQEAYIEKIDNALSVYWGKHSEYDCSDAPHCFIISDMLREEFKAKYHIEPMPFKSGGDAYAEAWASESTVRVVEYFVKTPSPKTVYLLDDGIIVDKVETGMVVVKSRVVQNYKIMHYVLSGDAVIESKLWPGTKYIPVIPIWGKEFNVAGKRILRGLIRNAKDPQRMYNYWQAVSLNTLLPTPYGWIKVKDVSVGDLVFDEKGLVCSVTDLSPVFTDRECVDVLFDDGSVITADVKHLWTVEERGKRKSNTYDWQIKTLTTDQLIPKKHFIYVADPLELPEQSYIIPPYVLGAWLGDGTSAEPNITQSPADWVELSEHLQFFGCTFSELHNKHTCVNVTLLGMRSKFKALNLLNNKHIPYAYVRGSKTQRLQLLQGLMDTDGSITSTGQCSFTTIIEEVAKGFSELLRTLGIKSTFCLRYREGTNVFDNAKAQYQFSFTTRLPVFRLSRKLAGLGKAEEQLRRTKRYSIKSIISVESEPVRCLTVNSESKLFLAGPGMIPTHNSSDTETVALQPKSPYILTPKQLEGHEKQWQEAHKKNYPYLLANADIDAPGWPHREPPPQMSSAMTTKLRDSDQEIRDTIGIQRASLGMQSNERSGEALREQKKEGDVGTFAFIDNLSRSLEHTGRVLVDIAPKILDTERIIRLGLDNGDYEFEAVNVEGPDGEMFNDLSVGTYDIVVTVGPSFATQRTEAKQSMKEFIQYFPAAAPIMGDLYAKAMDWPGAEEASQRLETLLPPEVRAKLEAERAKKTGEPATPPADPPVPPPDPLMEIKVAEANVKLDIEKIRLEEEEVKLEALKNSSEENLKKLISDVLNEDTKEEGGEKQ